MGLDEKEQRRAAKLKQEADEKAAKAKAKAEQWKAILKKNKERSAQNTKYLGEQLDKLGEGGKKMIEQGLRGYESWVTIMYMVEESNQNWEMASGALMLYVGSHLLLYPASYVWSATSMKMSDAVTNIKEAFVSENKPEPKIRGVRFHTDLSDDDELDLAAVEDHTQRTDNSPLTKTEKKDFVNAFADWIETTERGKYKVVQKPGTDKFQIFIKDPADPAAPGTLVKQAEFRKLRDDATHGFHPFLANRFKIQFEQLPTPPTASMGP